MRAIVLSIAGASLIGIAPANASVVTFGSSYAQSCYRAAEARDASRSAIEACDAALSAEPLSVYDRGGTHVNRGVLRMIAGDLVRANQDFDRALVLDSKQPEAWLNKAIVQMKSGNSRTALAMVDRSIELRTQKPAIAYYVRGIANEDAGNLRAAYAAFKRARDLAPKWSEPAVELARYQVKSR